MPSYANFASREEQLNYCRDYAPHRAWAVKNGLSVNGMPEEIRFQRIVEMYRLDDRKKSRLLAQKVQI
jgi:hypothetical protein